MIEIEFALIYLKQYLYYKLMDRNLKDYNLITHKNNIQGENPAINDSEIQKRGIIQIVKYKFQDIGTKKILILSIIVLVIIILTFSFSPPQEQHKQAVKFIKNTTVPAQQDQYIMLVMDQQQRIVQNKNVYQNDEESFPRILWVHTQKQLNGQRMIEQVSAKNWIDWGLKSNYDVRVVNNINAYQWLSEQMIQIVKYTKQTSKYGTSVYSILKLALLIEHGGLYLKINNALMLDEFPQINQQINNLLQSHQDKYFFSRNSPQIILFYSHQNNKNRVFRDQFIYSKKNSLLLRDVFEKLKIILFNGEWPYKELEGLQSVSLVSKVTYIHDMIYHMINANYQYFYTDPQEFIRKYKVLSLDIEGNFLVKQIQKQQFLNDIKKEESQFIKKHGNISIVITQPVVLWDILIQTFYTSSIQWASQKSIYANRIVRTQSNKWMLDYVDLSRPKVTFCIISLKTIGQFGYDRQIKQSLSRLKQQDFKQWQAIYFVQSLDEKYKKYSSQPNVTIVNSSLQQGLDFQRAAISYCGPKSIAVVLNYDQYFTKNDSLSLAKKQFSDVGMYGAYVATQTNNMTYINKFGAKKVWRIMLQPSQQLYDDVANHFRFVSIQSYRFLSHGNLHDDVYGRYFQTVIPFLTILQTFWNYDFCYKSQLSYHLKKIGKHYQIPKFRMTLNSIIITSPVRIKVSMKKFQYFNKYPGYQFCQAVGEFLNYKKRPIEEFFVLNTGVEFKGLKERQNKEMLIPKKIHQVWVGGQLPKYKKFIMDKNKQHHPDYEYYLWGNDNITKQNFPNSYYLIKRLLQFNNHSVFNKMSEVGDLMKHQLLYRHGGFYLDANYMTLKPHSLDAWRTFKAMYVSHYEPRQRLQRYSGLIGCVKNFKNFQRVMNHTVIGSRDYYSHEASIEAGPFLLSQAVRGEQQNDLQIYQPSFDHIYPYALPYKFLCQAPEETPQKQVLFKNKKTYYKNCSDIYYYAFGVDFFSQGLSWLHQKSK